MTTREEINSLVDMSYNEMKQELKMCGDNKLKEMIIRNLMKEKYINCMKKKKLIDEKVNKEIRESVMSKYKKNQLSDEDFKTEITVKQSTNKKRSINNDLMNRMNSEMDIIKHRTSKSKPAPPYENNGMNSGYAPYTV